MLFRGIVVRVPFLWVEGMALCPFVLVKRKYPTPVLLHHEQIHLRQQLETGFLLFYVWYLAEYLWRLARLRNHHRAYRSISFEREAFQWQGHTRYLAQRPRWAFLKYL
ncbi:hypothetical protein GCM10027275_35960 [Rhabdobacter roseus]|uniref:DUF4157 domain-containing protein n=1 Tax=Rhabdobacter roseus TaxID=1655419 RepID=A0A840U2C8_9BACT|nr:hypothetical protein [Rhabdobacter roseus]MBB5285999.1 hypothetical protein [Rhabdobacter roseus]